MTDTQEIEKIVHALVLALHPQQTVLSPQEHEFIKALYLREQRSSERWEKIKTQVLGWGALALVGWLGTVILDGIKHLVGK